MTRTAIRSGSPFEELAGYSRALVDGEWIFISATSGYDAEIGGFAEEAEDQARCALGVIGRTLAEAGATMADVVQVRVYLAERADVLPVSRLLGATFEHPRPANTTILCGFPAAEIKVEIEMVARRQAGGEAQA